MFDALLTIDILPRIKELSVPDENAVSHLALGQAHGFCVEDPVDRTRTNTSEIHVDFMVGGHDVDVIGVRRDDGEVPLLHGSTRQV